MPEKRKILVIAKCIPYPPHNGNNMRIYNLLRRMAADFDITLAALSDRTRIGDAEGLRPYCRSIHVHPIITDRSALGKCLLLFHPDEWSRIAQRLIRYLRGAPLGMLCIYFPAFRKLLREILAAERFDIVQFETIAGIYLPEVEDVLGDAKTVYVEHGLIADEIERMLERSGLAVRLSQGLEPLLFRRFERKLLPKFDQVISMSDREKHRLMALTGLPETGVTVVRTGVDTEEHRGVEIPGSGRRMALLGTMRFVPNREGFIWFMESVLPRIRERAPDAEIVVVGEEDPVITARYSAPGVFFRGVVDRLETELGRGMIFLAPIRIGAGTRTKIVTAMAFGMPVVSASVGIEGIDAGEGEGVMVADSPGDFAAAVIGLLEDDARRRLMGERAIAFVEREYSWDMIYRGLNALYRNLPETSRDAEKAPEARIRPLDSAASAGEMMA